MGHAAASALRQARLLLDRDGAACPPSRFREVHSRSQIAVTHRGQLTPEAHDYLTFVEEVMKLWKSAPHNADRTLFACPEMGPLLGYNITGLPPAWTDAVRLRQELARVWKRV